MTLQLTAHTGSVVIATNTRVFLNSCVLHSHQAWNQQTDGSTVQPHLLRDLSAHPTGLNIASNRKKLKTNVSSARKIHLRQNIHLRSSFEQTPVCISTGTADGSGQYRALRVLEWCCSAQQGAFKPEQLGLSSNLTFRRPLRFPSGRTRCPPQRRCPSPLPIAAPLSQIPCFQRATSSGQPLSARACA